LDFVAIGLFLLGAAIVGLLVFAATGLIANQRSSNESDLRTTAIGYLIVLAIVAAPFILGFTLDRWRKILFPIGVFAIGQGQKRHADKERLRSTVVVGFSCLSLLGLFCSYLRDELQPNNPSEGDESFKRDASIAFISLLSDAIRGRRLKLQSYTPLPITSIIVLEAE
jgi:MFS family permease